MTLVEPHWLVLILLAAIAIWQWRPPKGVLTLLRILILLIVIFAMTRPVLLKKMKGGTVVVVNDRSRSMPENSQQLQLEIITRLVKEMGEQDQIGVVSFASSAAIESPPQYGDFTSFVSDVGLEQSDLKSGLNLGLSLFPSEEPGRILVLSDGRWTGTDPSEVATRAASNRIAIDYVKMERDHINDVVIESLEAPSQIAVDESFMLGAWIKSPITTDISWKLSCSNKIVSTGIKSLGIGRNRLLFRDQANSSGTRLYTLEILPTTSDPVMENNIGRILVTARGRPQLLLVTTKPKSGLASLLRSVGIDVIEKNSASVDWSLAGLGSYSAIVLENVPASEIGLEGQNTLAAWVLNGSGGLLITGGHNSFGVGGYFRSPLDELLPVSMELRSEHRKLVLAVVIALDRSGSMAVPVGSGGRTKMDLANLAAAETVDILTAMDELGVIAVDSSVHLIAQVQRLNNKASLRQRILQIDSAGGGIFVYEALHKAVSMLAESEAGGRHILLFADAADAEQPGDYRELLKHCREVGITVSVIGLGLATDTDAKLLQDIATQANGNCFFTDNPHELPRLFAQDTFIFSKSTLIEEQTSLSFRPGMLSLTSNPLPSPPLIGGYNLCYLRQGAILGLATVDEYEAPIVAAWNAASGRVACYTGEADGTLTGELATWSHAGDLFGSITRWVMGTDIHLPPEYVVTQQLGKSNLQIRLYLDPEQNLNDAIDTPKLSFVKTQGKGKTTIREQTFRYLAADTLGVDIPLNGHEVTAATVFINGVGTRALPPVCLPYSHEVSPKKPGTDKLAQLAKISGGRNRIRPGSIWQDIPRTPRPLELAPLLFLIAIVVLLSEVSERRTGILQRLVSSIRKPISEKTSQQKNEDNTQINERVTPKVDTQEQKEKHPSLSADTEEDLLDALKKAKSRQHRRTHGK